MRFQSVLVLLMISACLLMLSGCDIFPKEVTPAPAAKNKEATGFGSPAARKAQANAEILQELYRVVLMREPDNRSEFGNLVDSMNQGASLEGTYNGFTHSSFYRKYEASNPGASAKSLSFFSAELAFIESSLSIPTDFDSSAAMPLSMPTEPEYVEDGSSDDNSADTKKAQPAKKDVKELEALYFKSFSRASIYTMKRVLGDEMLRLVAEKIQDREKFYRWFSDWAVRMASHKVDFGLQQRNSTDKAFYYAWATKADPDLIRWEILNRIHRILNAYNRDKQ